MSKLREKGKGFLGKKSENRVQDRYDGGVARPTEGSVKRERQTVSIAWLLGSGRAEDGLFEEEEAGLVGWRSSSSWQSGFRS